MKKYLRRKSKDFTIAILHHFVSPIGKQKYFSREHKITDNQTSDIVRYMQRLFRKRGYHVQVIKIEPNNLSDLKRIKAHFVFNLVDSKAMELKIARILDRLHVPHSGSSFRAIQTSNNKLRTKKIFLSHSLPTPSYAVIRLKDRLNRSFLPGTFPIIVKPAFEHCSIGITEKSIATNYNQFKEIVKRLRLKFRQTLIAEKFIHGKELHVTVLETPNKTVALPIAEIVFGKSRMENKWKIYGFDEKWKKKVPLYKKNRFISPPNGIDEKAKACIKRDSIRAFYALGFRDYARFDLRYDTKTNMWYFLEGNANAGFDPNPRDAMTASIKAHGMTLNDFALQIVKNSLS
ncbi:hypothetical protein KKB64_04390 [Patescibacteria group bacterium]|nr:hypothetical protein [Patescibacteria group bacterium]MBU2459949.1 hypothetical protein [Patescibacteria group bacterium]MBU2544795.1 hypothetical protein [Patescibacteria group bacterium]